MCRGWGKGFFLGGGFVVIVVCLFVFVVWFVFVFCGFFWGEGGLGGSQSFFLGWMLEYGYRSMRCLLCHVLNA